jgi:glycosyltransferase involved in cell wall biosynthesis
MNWKARIAPYLTGFSGRSGGDARSAGRSTQTSTMRGRAGYPVVSVVLGSYNRTGFLQKAIASVRDNGATVPYEIIVVDGGSTDGCAEWLITQKDIVTIVQHNRGEFLGRPVRRRSWGYFMNLGFRSAQGDYVLMISDDCLLLPNAIDQGAARFESAAGNRRVGAVAFYYRDWPREPDYCVQRTLGGMLMVNHGMYRRSVLDEVGWVDEDRYMFYKADGDLSLKIWQAGYEILDCPGALLEHHVAANSNVRETNNALLDRDRAAYLDRWRGIYYHDYRPDARGRMTLKFEDPQRTAERAWLGTGSEPPDGKALSEAPPAIR